MPNPLTSCYFFLAPFFLAAFFFAGIRKSPPLALDLLRFQPAAELPPGAQRFSGNVESLLFDGANSAVLVREALSRAEIRIALPQTGRFADLAVGETIAFGVEPGRAACFAARSDAG